MNANIIGVGSIRFHEHWNLGIKELVGEACKNALISAKLGLKDIDSLYVANCFNGFIHGQDNVNTVCSNLLGIDNSTVIGGGDASGAFAVVQAANAIRSGSSKIALVVGVEKVSDLGTNDLTEVTSQFMDYQHEAYPGATLASLYAMITLKHKELFGTTDNQLSIASAKNHSNASENDIARYKFKIAAEDVMKSPLVADPIRVLNSASPSDGSCAIIMCNEKIAETYKDKIKLLGTGIGSDSLAVHERKDITTFNAVKNASKIAIENAGIKLDDVSFAEVYDTFSIGEIMSIEDLGFVKKGVGGKFIEDGSANIDGKIPINPSGGLKGCGHPFAASGVRQVIEAFQQLNNQAGNRQVKNAKYALTEAISGTGASAVVNIFSK